MANTTEAPAETPAPEKQKRKPHVGRRAFLATAATVTACGAGALAAPTVIPLLESKARETGRDALLNEIGSLEGVSLDAAIRAAEVTRAAVQVLVLPLARYFSLMGTGALALLLGALDLARKAMALLHLNTSVLDAFRDVVASWQGGIASLPIALDAYTTTDINSGEKYLRALKQMAEHPHVG
jgi:hypothetical protein